MRPCAVLLCLTFFLAFVDCAAAAQERKGSITGWVTDSSQAALQGARIEIVPSGPRAFADSLIAELGARAECAHTLTFKNPGTDGTFPE